MLSYWQSKTTITKMAIAMVKDTMLTPRYENINIIRKQSYKTPLY